MIVSAVLICLSPVALDGDTLRCGSGPATVRIFGVQAPERSTAGWIESMANLNKESMGGLLCEPRGTNYNRIVALCRNFRGVDIGKAQLDGGFAVEWCSYSRNFYATCQVTRRR